MIGFLQSVGSLAAEPGNGLETFGTLVALGVLAVCLIAVGARRGRPS